MGAELFDSRFQVDPDGSGVIIGYHRVDFHHRNPGVQLHDEGIGLPFIVADYAVNQTRSQNTRGVFGLLHGGVFQQNGHVAPLLAEFLKELEHLVEIWVIQLRNSDGDDVGFSRPQALGEGIGAVVQLLDRLRDSLAGILPHVIGCFQVFGNGGDADTGQLCHVFNGGHGAPAFRSCIDFSSL